MQHTPTAIVMVAVPLYVIGAFLSTMFSHADESPAPSEPLRMTFVGDMMFDRYVREKANVNGYQSILKDVAPLFASSTYVLGNLEGPITTFTPIAQYADQGPGHYQFTFATSVASLLNEVGFRAVTLGNNHIMNFGAEGLEQTTEWLLQNGVDYVGAPNDRYIPWRGVTASQEVAVYAYDLWYSNDVKQLIERIQAEPDDTFVVVYAHWGDEYSQTPSESQVKLAHTLVDAGADFIVGSHPHVVQTKEYYRGAWIYYSLGNFVFDQYFSSHVRCGAVVTATRTPGGSIVVDEAFVALASDGTTRTSDCMSEVPLQEPPSGV